jgi:hypothetical protein
LRIGGYFAAEVDVGRKNTIIKIVPVAICIWLIAVVLVPDSAVSIVIVHNYGSSGVYSRGVARTARGFRDGSSI